ncbi:uncharacterized protein ColSpa_05282 [Colletotrichum spaethianum]|uniref:Uncharacterized protein n=1 Tax=Colletotrichum spaethianum TaxID=700344 RepID=A0AA37LAK3_9PEZI|nr:uncharacterized protein ColSpa_05282 [Colletotrichum spaethianum]GKT45101.1 hypothetical protein ColSpa_05282 [Colletotrichum spaethianum]
MEKGTGGNDEEMRNESEDEVRGETRDERRETAKRRGWRLQPLRNWIKRMMKKARQKGRRRGAVGIERSREQKPKKQERKHGQIMH